MAELIDTRHLGHERVIGAWLSEGRLIDPGPASTVDAVLDALGERRPRALLLTHIHLDHAGAAGTLCQRFPELRVYVHEVGAPHLIDPSRLWSSAARLYGEHEMERLWGRVDPVPAERVTTLAGGERIEGMEVIAAPGHAAHHVVYLDSDDGSAYAGDVAGVRIPPGDLTLMPTPPPEIDVEGWLASLERLAAAGPERLHLTHFGEVADAAAQLDEAAEALRWAAELAAAGDRTRFLDAIEARIDAQPSEPAAQMRAAMPPEQVWLGLERYWSKRRRGR